MNLYEFYNKKLEYSLDAVAADKELAKHIQDVLIWLKLLTPPSDGKFGPISATTLKEFQALMKCEEDEFLGPKTAKALVSTKPEDLPQPELKLGNDLASRIIKYMQEKGYQVTTKAGEYNIVYVEGMEADGTLNSDQANCFNDRRMVVEIVKGKPKVIGNWEGTTEPGFHYTYHPMTSKGVARIAFGQYKAWRIGIHYGGGSDPHEALVQVAPITVHRDFNQDMKRTGDKLDTGLFDVNQHWGFDLPRNNISFASAGCLVGRTREGHREFIKLLKQDKRYQMNREYIFFTAIIPGDELSK
jgi:hypothetical protein